ncbi:DNA polymerase/3'-5' exonuclease PolX [Terribacillus saccharophilus]|uniref:DNA polymerase/3'-5' exonuclease PolX n=1 Tax=Terribacillus saccharophilus TaxID=361277 RepID=UPI000BA723D2|nr:DNA polymerase/3'-5' exonuclease PolX [Terribacillus saccharophilus]PAF19913.1 DNA polymerase/3'-5' exonuclease PolX [Terribacillus saccharophilus]PAF21678.1 DNA polymerase/3'-5' exonuclease PolX [Terribacillus saccharophilus]PAF35112.1 DNA polymerase/3'-5' exonuclease PolX [Terribacillus saccharophilus]PAF37889.1 DNA polymerase/3'-5' exonuclease PolX [Terribacillus saccharophilus]
MAINKKDVVKLLETIAIYLELKGENTFKVSAYRKAAAALEANDQSIDEIEDFTKLNGIGKGTAAVIEEYIKDEQSDTLRQLQEEVPEGLVPLLDLPGLGGKKLAKLYQELGVIDAASLKEAVESGKVASLSGFGKKSAEKILDGLANVGSRPERIPIAMMLPLAERIESFLESLDDIEQYARAGSLRRMQETVKDLDFIIATNDPKSVQEQLLTIDNLKEVIAKGDTKVSVTLEEGYDINVDFRLIEPAAFATTLHHFTGSADHNVALRQLAKKRGERISEYGVENVETGELTTFQSEKEFFGHFGLSFIPPEVREAQGELESFKQEMPLVQLSDIQGDLHMHSTWSDGAQSIEQMAKQAIELGYSYIAITDHSKYLKVANGLDEKRLRKQREEIERINALYPDFHIFAGVEMDILPDARLDFEDDFLQEMDYVIGAIHSSFSQSADQIKERLTAALEHPNVNVIAHPTGRLIGRRAGYAADPDWLLEKAAETGTVIELNANPNRLDLSWTYLKKAQELGVKIAVNTDAHSYATLSFMEVGVAMARKGWLKPETVINTWSKQQLMELFQRS